MGNHGGMGSIQGAGSTQMPRHSMLDRRSRDPIVISNDNLLLHNDQSKFHPLILSMLLLVTSHHIVHIKVNIKLPGKE
jgi:hypothetical protein